MIIAIDGPAGSGKSTVAKMAAKRLGFHYLDTGAMYRAVAYRALEKGVDTTDEQGVATIAFSEAVTFVHDPGEALPSKVHIDGIDVTDAIRTPAVDDAVSAVARLPRVRDAMVAQQRTIGESTDIVVEGRDIGTVVFPDAEVKVYLTADSAERARRRAVEQADRGHEVDAQTVRESIERRDAADSSRDVSPLAAASDAVQIDTTGLTIDQVVDRVLSLSAEARS